MTEGYIYWRVEPASLAELARIIAAHWPQDGPVYRWQEKLEEGKLEEVDAIWRDGLLADPPTAVTPASTTIPPVMFISFGLPPPCMTAVPGFGMATTPSICTFPFIIKLP